MNHIRQYINSLFSGYEETNALIDFKEELESNLNDRINSLKKKGLSEEQASEKAIAELGDMSALADELSLKKKQEIFSDMYMKTRNYIGPWRMALYVLCGMVLVLGVIVGVTSWLFTNNVLALWGSLLPFVLTSVLGLVYLGLTQETASREKMPRKRVLWYVAASGIFLFGILVFVMTYFAQGAGLPHAIASLIPFALPGLALGIFLVLTEKDRSKPWVIELRKKALEREQERFVSPAQQERFGLLSGALWIGAAAVFILFTMTVGLKFSWLAFPAALIGQMLILTAFSKKE